MHLKKYCVFILEEVGSLQYTRKVLEKLDLEIRAEVRNLIFIYIFTFVIDKRINIFLMRPLSRGRLKGYILC